MQCSFIVHKCHCALPLFFPLPINTRAVSPHFPQATRRVHIMPVEAVQERVDAVESVGSVQLPPAAG